MYGQKVVPFRHRARWQKPAHRLSRERQQNIWKVPFLLSLALAAFMILKQGGYSPLQTSTVEWADVLYVYDGDTLTVSMANSDGSSRKQRVRLLDIDTAELDGARCRTERSLAIQQRDYLASLVGGRVQLSITGTDRYDRLLAAVYNEAGENVSERMIAEAGARPYSGGPRRGWC